MRRTRAPEGIVPAAARMRGRGWLSVLAAVAVAATVGGWLAGRSMVSPRELAAKSAPPTATIITDKVVSQRLQRTVVTRGIVSAVDVIQVGLGKLIPPTVGADSPGPSQPGEGDDVLTGVFRRQGQTVSGGQAVVEVNGRPVIVLHGPVASYRDMKPGMTGTDIAELQRSLTELADYTGAITGTFDTATKSAVSLLYEKLGYPVPTTDGGDGSDQAAIQAANAVSDAADLALKQVKQQRAAANATFELQLEKWHRARGIDPGAAGSRPVYAGPSESDIATAEHTAAQAQRAMTSVSLIRGAMVPRTEAVFVPRLPASVTQIGRQVGYPPGSPLFTLTPSAMVLSAQVAGTDAGLLRKGDPAEIDLPSGTVTGRIASSNARTAEGEVSFTISTPEPLAFSLAGADVKVTFTAAATPQKVLAVPQGAVSSDATGKLSVIVQRPDLSLIRVPVAVGVAATDLIEVTPKTPGSLTAGERVVIGG